MEETKFINFKSLKLGKDKKERDTVQINLSQEQAADVLGEITKNAENPRGVKISLHYQEEQKPWGPGYNGFLIVNPVSEPGAGFKGKGQQQGKFVPKAKTNNTATTAANKARAASALNTQIED